MLLSQFSSMDTDIQSKKQNSFMQNPLYVDFKILIDKITLKTQLNTDKLRILMMNISKIAESKEKYLKNKVVIDIFETIHKVIRFFRYLKTLLVRT